MRSESFVVLAVFLGACSDYTVNAKTDPEDGAGDGVGDVPDFGGTGATDGSGGTDTGWINAEAKEPIYINEGDRLWSWDPADDALVEIGRFSDVDRMTDIAVDPLGNLWGCSGSSDERGLYRIDPETAETTWVAELPKYLSGLTFLGDGRLVGAGDGVWVLDQTTGALRDTLVPEGQYVTSGDIVALPDGLLYWTVWPEEYGEADRLLVINPAGGVAVRGEADVSRVFGLGYADNALYGFTDDGNWVKLSQSTGSLQLTGPLPGNSGWWGATTNPVLWD